MFVLSQTTYIVDNPGIILHHKQNTVKQSGNPVYSGSIQLRRPTLYTKIRLYDTDFLSWFRIDSSSVRIRLSLALSLLSLSVSPFHNISSVTVFVLA